MKRRELLSVGGGTLLMPRIAQALPRRIAVLGPDATDGQGPVWDAFVDELARRDQVVGRDIVFERRFGSGDQPAELERLAQELAALRPDLIYAARGTASALAAKSASASIPIVFFSSGDPVRLGLVASLAKPGGNLTGASVQGFDIIAKGLQYLSEALGPVRRLAYLTPTGVRGQPWFAALEGALLSASRALGATITFVDVGSVDEIDAIAARLANERFNAVIAADFPLFRPRSKQIARLFAENRLPAYGYAPDGYLMHYGESRLALARMAAAYVDRILRGARPADLPVEQLAVFELAINLKTARTLALKIPQALLARADELIEA